MTIALFLISGASHARAENNRLAKALAPQLRPLGLTPRADPQGLNQLRPRLVEILSAMQASYKGGGPDGRTLISSSLELVPSVGDAQRMMLIGNLTQMWTEARALGCFGADHKFTGLITQGPDSGSQAVFEFIVPVEQAPRLSREISNVRLVAPSRSREKGGADSARDAAFAKQLEAVESEMQHGANQAKIAKDNKPKPEPVRNSMGETAAEQSARFQAEMARAGDAAGKPPSLKLQGRLIQQPSKRNNYCWSYGIDLRNISAHPAELTVEWWILGKTDIKRINYLMAKGSEKVQLRGAGVQALEFKTKPKSTYDNFADDLDELPAKDKRRAKTEPDYRGAVIRVLHGKDTVIATWASDATMARALMEDPPAEVDLERLPGPDGR
ncbi:hypothetical protein [Prosthecobacter sp.]|uniref:hypothetical protein n=1 Tax=Prosthecobacter sp. TaxID=1965333 RepID=UPI001D984C2A|nr:hypothetical protein [Prosthecobacter sp.]MCB1276453.1 hypothetical protein [Prosthecobacter sp.]